MLQNKITLVIALLAITATFAGCHAPEGEGGNDTADPTHTPDGGDNAAGNITLTVTDAPTTVAANESFNVTVMVDADGTVTSDHFGAHWSFNSTANDTDLAADDFDGASPHVTNSTQIGAEYTINGWTFSSEHVGTIYYRAHVRTTAGENFWGEEQTLEVTAA